MNSFQQEALNCTLIYEDYIEESMDLGATQKIIDFFQGTVSTSCYPFNLSFCYILPLNFILYTCILLVLVDALVFQHLYFRVVTLCCSLDLRFFCVFP